MLDTSYKHIYQKKNTKKLDHLKLNMVQKLIKKRNNIFWLKFWKVWFSQNMEQIMPIERWGRMHSYDISFFCFREKETFQNFTSKMQLRFLPILVWLFHFLFWPAFFQTATLCTASTQCSFPPFVKTILSKI